MDSELEKTMNKLCAARLEAEAMGFTFTAAAMYTILDQIKAQRQALARLEVKSHAEEEKGKDLAGSPMH